MDPEALYRRYKELQAYVGWAEADARRVRCLAPLLEPFLPALVDDFYQEIDRHPEARKVITGGPAQVERLKGTLTQWLRELLSGPYDRDYAARRWRAGRRHVEVGLDQVYTNVALSRLRRGLLRALEQTLHGEPREVLRIRQSLNTLLDLDLAIIEDAYQAEHLARQQLLEKARGEAAFRTLVEAAPSLIVILRADASVAYFSPFAEQITGHGAEEVRGRNFLDLFIPDDALRQTIRDKIKGNLAGTPTHEFETPITCKDGLRRWVNWNARVLPDYEGGPAVLAIGQDITSLKEAQEKTLRAERLAAIGQMMTGLTHESGNALARSQACLEVLALEVEDRPDALELIGRIQKAQDHLRRLYEEVRGYAAPLQIQREVWDLRSVWRQAWTNLAVQRQGRQATLRELAACGGLDLPIDPFRLEQVFRNLLENALAACPDPAEIDIACTETKLNGHPAVCVSVRDNGPGLTAEQRQRIFEPFFTTKTKGTGLGMAITQRIVEAHGGRIVVAAPVPAGGAEILITLPRHDPAIATP